MLRCILTLEAEQDLKNIADYTFEKWGISQAIQYSETLDTCFDSIANKNAIPKRLTIDNSNVFYLLCEKHYIFYLEDHRRSKKKNKFCYVRLNV